MPSRSAVSRSRATSSARERRLLQEKRRDAIVLHDGEARPRVPAARVARLLRQRHQPQAVEHPARDRQHAVVGQVIEVVVERLDRVERVLGQRVGAGRRRGPRVHERRLDHVVAIGRPPHEAAAVVDGDADARVGVDAARELAEPVAHHVVGDDRVDLDAVHACGAEDQRRDEVASAARTDDERGEAAASALQLIRERRELVPEVLDVGQVGRRRGGSAWTRPNRCP